MKHLRWLPLLVSALLMATPAQAQVVQGQYTAYGTITTNTAGPGNAVALFPLYNVGTCSGVITGTWTGTLEFDVSGDGGNTPSSVFTTDPTITQIASSQTTANKSFIAYVSNFRFFEVRSVAAMTGTAVVQFSCGSVDGGH